MCTLTVTHYTLHIIHYTSISFLLYISRVKAYGRLCACVYIYISILVHNKFNCFPSLCVLLLSHICVKDNNDDSKAWCWSCLVHPLTAILHESNKQQILTWR